MDVVTNRAQRSRGTAGRGLASRRRRVWALPLVLCAAVLWASACAAHAGGDEIAFVRGGQLWTVYGDGTSAVEIAQGGVVGFAWSPDHHQLVLRYTGKSVPTNASGLAPDAPSELAVTGVDGGSPVQITPQVSGMARSDAWWDPNGNRLVYREGFAPTTGQEPTTLVYVLSQADQPAGIARKPLLDVALMPALSGDGAQVAVVDSEGDVRLGRPGAAGTIIAARALLTLPGGTRPARLLWRPRHDELLYASAANTGTQLVLSSLTGRKLSTLPLAGVLDYAFSPDGSMLLVQTSDGFTVWPLGAAGFGHAPLDTWPEADVTVLAWWSPTSRAVLVRDQAGYGLATIATRQLIRLVQAGDAAGLPATAASWRPLTGSPWDASGDAFVFRDTGGGNWLGATLPQPRGVAGLYVGSTAHPSQQPVLIDSGDDSAPSWSYQAPDASWLAPS
jgi:hypothetical protein